MTIGGPRCARPGDPLPAAADAGHRRRHRGADHRGAALARHGLGPAAVEEVRPDRPPAGMAVGDHRRRAGPRCDVRRHDAAVRPDESGSRYRHLRDAGEKLYLANCAACHGVDARGGGPEAGTTPGPAARPQIRPPQPAHRRRHLLLDLVRACRAACRPGVGAVRDRPLEPRELPALHQRPRPDRAAGLGRRGAGASASPVAGVGRSPRVPRETTHDRRRRADRDRRARGPGPVPVHQPRPAEHDTRARRGRADAAAPRGRLVRSARARRPAADVHGRQARHEPGRLRRTASREPPGDRASRWSSCTGRTATGSSPSASSDGAVSRRRPRPSDGAASSSRARPGLPRQPRRREAEAAYSAARSW